MHVLFASTPLSVVTPAALDSVNVPRSLTSPSVPLPRSVCVVPRVTPSRWLAIVPCSRRVDAGMQKST
jgi:hypothetical protein